MLECPKYTEIRNKYLTKTMHEIFGYDMEKDKCMSWINWYHTINYLTHPPKHRLYILNSALNFIHESQRFNTYFDNKNKIKASKTTNQQLNIHPIPNKE